MEYEVCGHPDLFSITQGLLVLCGHYCCSTEEENSEMLYQRFRQGNVLISHKGYSKYHNESVHKSARDLLHKDEENSLVLP